MSFKAILLDLDNTLYDYATAHKPALDVSVKWLSEQYGESDDTVLGAYKTARSQINKELHGQAASHSRLLYFQRIAEILGQKPCSTVLQAESLYWDTFLNHMQFRDGAIDFLDAVSGFKIAIVTDLTAQIQFRKLIKLGIDKRFQAIVTSEESGAEKPDRRIFDLALRKLGVSSGESCVIGDNWDKDVIGGVAAGMRSYWMRFDQESPLSRTVDSSKAGSAHGEDSKTGSAGDGVAESETRSAGNVEQAEGNVEHAGLNVAQAEGNAVEVENFAHLLNLIQKEWR